MGGKFTGTVQLTVAEAFPAFAVTAVGALGTVRGVVEDEAVDALEAPATLYALTVKV